MLKSCCLLQKKNCVKNQYSDGEKYMKSFPKLHYRLMFVKNRNFPPTSMYKTETLISGLSFSDG